MVAVWFRRRAPPSGRGHRRARPRGGQGGGRGDGHRRRPPRRALARTAYDHRMTEGRVGDVVVGEDELQARIAALGKEITADYSDRAPLLVGVLKGAFVFMSDLARNIDLPVEVDFMAVSSYGSSTKTSGIVRIVKDLELDLVDRHVVIVEDIVDSGLTLRWLRRNLASRNPASVEVCALLVKEGLQREDPELKYVGFRIPPDFVVGYGLDVDQRHRNIPEVRRWEE